MMRIYNEKKTQEGIHRQYDQWINLKHTNDRTEVKTETKKDTCQ